MSSKLIRGLLSFGLLAMLVGCAEPDTQAYMEPIGGRGGQNPRPDYGRIDRGTNKQDMRVTQPRDMGGVDAAIPEPSEYVPYGQCPEEITFVGQVTGPSARVPNGGSPIFVPYDRNYNSGLDSIFARLPQPSSGDDPEPVTVDIQVDRATVVATRPRANADGAVSTSRGRFWVADGRRTLEMFLTLSNREVPSFEIQVGQIISFTAKTIGYYGLRPQVQKASGFVLHETGTAHSSIAQAGSVSIMDEPTLSTDDIPKIVRVTRLLEGEAVRCGGTFNCWQLDGPQNLIYRTETEDLRAGTCISFVGPVSGFGDQVQLEAFNPAWVKRYQVGGAFEESCLTGRDCASGVCVTIGEDKFCSMQCELDSDCPARYDCTFERCLPSFGSECPEDVTFKGQYQGRDSLAPNGGEFSLDPYPDDFRANIATVNAQAPAASSNNPTPVITEILIEGAVVTSTHSGLESEAIGSSGNQIKASQARFTLGDGAGNVEVFLDLGGNGVTPDFTIKSGMVVSLIATQLDRHQGKAQIKRAVWAPFDPNLVAHPEVGIGENARISVYEPSRAFARSDLSRIVRVTGILEGNGDRCGGNNRCWTLNYGFGQPVVVRSASEEAYTGACVTYTGPLGFYNGNYQLDVSNPDWLVVNDGESSTP